MALLQQQQNWFWQQPQQFQPLPYPQYPQYGNFVPNFIFGMVDPPAWVEEEEEEPEAEPAVGAGVEHGPVHDISDDETDEVQPSGPVLPVPEQDGGITAGLIDNQLTFSEVKEADKQSAPVQDRVANLLEKYLKDAHSVMEMDRLAKAHPRVANVEAMKVPRLDEEVYQEVDQKSRATDMTFQSIQKGVLGAMSAFAPVLDLVFLRKQKDKELDKLGEGVMHGLQLLGQVHSALSSRRRENLKTQLSPVYARAICKHTEGENEWLYGGNLEETTKQCEVAKKIGGDEKEPVPRESPVPSDLPAVS